MRFPLGILAQYIGRKNGDAGRDGADRVRDAVRLHDGRVASATCWRWVCCSALPAPASAWRCRSARAPFPPRTKGSRWGSSAPATSGPRSRYSSPAARSTLRLANGLRDRSRRRAVPMLVMIVFARGARRRGCSRQLREHVACLFEKDGWAFSMIYAVTFGGFIGLTSFLPSYYYDQFGVSKVEAGQLTMLAAFMGAAAARVRRLDRRPLGRRQHVDGRAGVRGRDAGLAASRPIRWSPRRCC